MGYAVASINSSSLAGTGNRGTDILPAATANAILNHYDKYRYAPDEHSLIASRSLTHPSSECTDSGAPFISCMDWSCTSSTSS